MTYKYTTSHEIKPSQIYKHFIKTHINRGIYTDSNLENWRVISFRVPLLGEYYIVVSPFNGNVVKCNEFDDFKISDPRFIVKPLENHEVWE